MVTLILMVCLQFEGGNCLHVEGDCILRKPKNQRLQADSAATPCQANKISGVALESAGLGFDEHPYVKMTRWLEQQGARFATFGRDVVSLVGAIPTRVSRLTG